MKRGEAIRRFQQMKKILSIPNSDAERMKEALDMAIRELQDRPTGTWIVKHGNYCGVELKEFFCDKCGTRGALRRVFSDSEPLPNFCGNCGADMRGEQE